MNISEQLTYCTTKIVSVIDENQIATGTGFFMNFNEDLEKDTCQPVIITNKHVVENAKKSFFLFVEQMKIIIHWIKKNLL